MVNTLYAVIRSRRFDLATLLNRIHYYHAAGDITTEQMEELIRAARECAADTLEVDAKTEILALWDAVHELQRQIAELTAPTEDDGGEEPGENPVTEPEIPEYIQPTGAHDAYNAGDLVSYQGEVWRCIMNNCVWAPDVYPAGWEKVQ